MTRWGLAAVVACVAAVAASGAVRGQPAGPLPLGAYGRLPAIEQVAISPDGQRLALILTDGEQRNVVVESVADHKVIGGINAGETKVRALQWAGSNHLLVTVSSTQTIAEVAGRHEEWLQAIDFDVDHQTQKQVLTGVVNAAHILFSAPAVRIINGKPYAFAEGFHIQRAYGRLALFKIDIEQGGTTLVTDGLESAAGWLVDAGGEPVATINNDSDRGHWALRVKRGTEWKLVKSADDKLEHPEVLGLGRDGRSVVLAEADSQGGALHELSPEADDWGPALSPEPGPGPVFDPVTETLIGLHVLAGNRERYQFFADTDQAMWKAVQRAYPGARIRLESMSADHKRVVVSVDSMTDGLAYALVDIDAHAAGWIGDAYKQAATDVASVQPLAFKAADGTDLTGYLTLPNHRGVTGMPLVVLPHGGPASRDEPGFDWWAQALASRGYAVLQVNYRGSDGFGWAFLSSGFGQWGRKMQSDLSDGVRYLAAQGKVDPKRVCIVGASYGGYAALAGAALEPEVYRCAVSVAGISDPRRFVAWSRDQHNLAVQRYWLRFMGADGAGDSRLDEISPAAHAGQVTAPILLIHGQDDSVVPFEQSQIMAAALRRAGKSVELTPLAHEDHWLSRGATRLQMLEAVVGFLQKNNPPG